MRTRFLRGTRDQNNGLILPEGEISIDEETKAVRLHDGVTPGGFEMVGNPIEFPLPGPTTLLAGDETTGFYGETTTTEFITGNDLANLVGLSAGTPQSSTVPWLKFSLDGKVLYVAKHPYRYSISWNTLVQNNLINRAEPIKIGETYYYIRLMKGADANPTSLANSENYRTETASSEWDRLMYPIHEWDPTGAGWGINYTRYEIKTNGTSGASSWMQEESSSTTSAAITRGYGTTGQIYTFYTIDKNNDTSGTGWRPVLEPV